MLSANLYIPLPQRGVIKLTGDDVRPFLQGIITRTIDALSASNAIYACLLTPQGKYLFDFFIAEHEGALWLDAARDTLPDLIKKLSMYKLRSKVTIEDVSAEYEVAALLGDRVFEEDTIRDKKPGSTRPFCNGIAYIDPRNEAAFARAIIKRENDYKSFEAKGFSRGDISEYERLRLSLGVPDSNRDLIPEKSFPLQHRLDELNAIDFDKGCYVGQEVTARTKHRGVVRKNLFVVKTDTAAALPPTGTPITNGTREVGQMRSSEGNIGLALLEIEEINASLTADSVKISVKK